MSGINISEKEDRRVGELPFSGLSDLDIRVSTLPTLYGESISLRLLNENPNLVDAGARFAEHG